MEVSSMCSGVAARVAWSLVALVALAAVVAVGVTGQDFLFPDQYLEMQRSRANVTSRSPAPRQDEIWSLEMARKLDELGDVDMFLEELLEDRDQYHTDTITEIGSRFGISSTNSKPRAGLAPAAKHAACVPRPTPVTLAGSGNEMIVPPCALLPRCGGCCASTLLECRPIKVKQSSLRAYALRKTSNLKAVYKKVVTIPVEEHEECVCGCRQQKEHCTKHQMYVENDCRCVCPDVQEERACSNSRDRRWDNSTCSCMCIEISECSSGAYWDHSTCQCRRR